MVDTLAFHKVTGSNLKKLKTSTCLDSTPNVQVNALLKVIGFFLDNLVPPTG